MISTQPAPGPIPDAEVHADTSAAIGDAISRQSISLTEILNQTGNGAIAQIYKRQLWSLIDAGRKSNFAEMGDVTRRELPGSPGPSVAAVDMAEKLGFVTLSGRGTSRVIHFTDTAKQIHGA